MVIFKKINTSQSIHRTTNLGVHTLNLSILNLQHYNPGNIWCLRHPTDAFTISYCHYIFVMKNYIHLNPDIAYFKGLVKIMLYTEVLFIANI